METRPGTRPGILVRRFHTILRKRFGDYSRGVIVRAPGRVNLIGDHTDYNDGFVLPATIDRDVYVGVVEREDNRVQIYSLNFRDEIEYELGRQRGAPVSSWESYLTGAVEELRSRDLLPGGFGMLVYGNVPLGAGLSSSAALEVAAVYGLQSLFGFELPPVEAIRLSQQVEHRYVGVQCGIMDQFASYMGRRGHALFLDCRTLEHEHVPLPLSEAGLAIAIVDSRVARELARSKYSERLLECDRVVQTLQKVEPSVTALRDVSSAMLQEHRSLLEETLQRRARHVVDENQRVQRARDALLSGSYELFGRLMNESHESLRTLYEVSISELDHLVEAAQNSPGVLGARMTGGGFGGCTVNLVRRNAVAEFERHVMTTYAAEFGREPHVYILRQNHQMELLHSEP